MPSEEENSPLLEQDGPEVDDDDQEALICGDCSSTLCPSCQQVLEVLSKRAKECNKFYNMTPLQMALRRMPALVITMSLELAGGGIIARMSDTLSHFILISSFIPVIAALSGNLGLQTSGNIVRGLATGNVNQSRFFYEVRKEITTGLFCSTAIAILLGIIGTLWICLDPTESEFRNQIKSYELIFGGVILLGAFLSMLLSSTNGSLIPFVASLLKLDPAKFSGPMETAFQDIAGVGFLLGLAHAILLPLSPEPQATPAPTCSPHP